MFPEWANIALSELILLGYIGKDATHLLPLEFPELQFAEDGLSASYAVKYPTGVTLEASTRVISADLVKMELTVTNRAKRFFPGIDFTACLNLIDMGEEFSGPDPGLKIFTANGALTSFDCLHHPDGRELSMAEKAFVAVPVQGSVGCYENFWSNGVWTRNRQPVIEKASLPFLARKSADDDRFIAICWPRARFIMSNIKLACLHADPTVPNCPSGEQVSINGAIIFHQGSPESLVRRITQELESLAKEERVWTEWHI